MIKNNKFKYIEFTVHEGVYYAITIAHKSKDSWESYDRTNGWFMYLYISTHHQRYSEANNKQHNFTIDGAGDITCFKFIKEIQNNYVKKIFKWEDNKCIKIGWDYMHSWNEREERYTLNDFLNDDKSIFQDNVDLLVRFMETKEVKDD